MPRAANPFDYATIADVLVTIDYSALDSTDYRPQVLQTLARPLSADRPFSFRNQLADAWYDFHNPDQSATPMSVLFSVTPDDFPPNLDDLRIQQLVLYFSRKPGSNFEVDVRSLTFTEAGSTNAAGVDDVRRACEALLNLWTQEPVSVRDESDSDHCASIPRCRPRGAAARAIANRRGPFPSRILSSSPAIRRAFTHASSGPREATRGRPDIPWCNSFGIAGRN
jgi:hypothetical protein